MDVADGDRFHAETDHGAFRHHAGIGAVRHTLQPFRLVEQIGKLRAGALEAGRVDVRDIVGDDFQIELLGIHAGCRDGECFHVNSPFRSAYG